MSNKEIIADDFVVTGVHPEDPKQSVIERHNVVSEFTLEDIEGHQADLAKYDKELSSQVDVCQATIDNIEKNHEFVQELTDEQKHHVWMLYENEKTRENAESKLQQVRDQAEQYEAIVAVVKDKLNLDEQTEGNTEKESG